MDYTRLANAIIENAATDYRRLRKRLRDAKKQDRRSDIYSLERAIKEIEGFFLSDWFCVLSSSDGKYLLKRLEEEQI